MKFYCGLLSCSLLLLNACSDSTVTEPVVVTQSIPACEGDVYVSGIVEREFRNHSWNEPFIASEDTHVHMSLTEHPFDGSPATVAERNFKFVGLPFSYSLCVDNSVRSFYLEGMAVSARIYNHAGSDGRVGDLVSEYLNEILEPTTDLTILVSGLEHCDSPNSGGFCTTKE